MDSQKSRDITKDDILTWTIFGVVILVIIYLDDCGYDVGAIIGTCVFLFLAGGAFILHKNEDKEKKIAIEYPADWDEIRKRILERDSFTCCNCQATNTILHVHHVVPLTRGGTSIDSNLITLCEDCHKFIHPHMS